LAISPTAALTQTLSGDAPHVMVEKRFDINNESPAHAHVDDTMEPIIITPNKADTMGPGDLSGQIIQSLTSEDSSDIIAIGSVIPRVISAINFSGNIANVNIKNVFIDIITIPLYGKQEAIHVELSRKVEEHPKIISEFENIVDDKDMIIWVSRRDDVTRITNLILYRLNIFDKIKIIASGFAITTAVNAVLQVSKSGISRDIVSISAVKLESLKGRRQKGKYVPAISIYLEKGKETEYSQNHIDLISILLEGG